MSHALPMAEEEYFDEVEYQSQTIKVGDTVIVHHTGEEKMVEVTSLSKKQGHYWVGFDHNNHVCPWPLVRPIQGN